jgi:eukaryotic-like serine/threonine-protein kinase
VDWRFHVDLAVAALARGALDHRQVVQGLLALRFADERSDPDLWVAGGLLSPSQLAEAMTTAGVGGVAARRTQPRWVLDPRSGTEPTRPAHTAEARGHLSVVPAASVRIGRDTETPLQRYPSAGMLAAGGMGEIHVCEDRLLGRRVAKKVLRTGASADVIAGRLLEREARLTARLEHPGIIPVYDLGQDRDQPGYVMRLVDQPTLDEVLHRLRDDDHDTAARFTQGRLLRCFVQVCEAVDYAHSRGVIHCDLKPSNVLIGEFGEVLVVDWGLAFSIEEGTLHRGGTLGYMAPEQLDLSRRAMEPTTDVFSLGVILYELLTLRLPFPALGLATVDQGAAAFPPPRPPSELAPLPEELDEICLRALALEPAARFPGARALADAVGRFLEGTLERERRAQRADELTAQADRLAEAYAEIREQRRQLEDDIAAVQARLSPWEAAEHKTALWDAEERLQVTDVLAIRTLQAAIAGFEQALDDVPDHAAARRGLALLYAAEAERARARRNELQRHYFEGLVEQYDAAGRFVPTHGRLTVSAPGAAIELGRYRERGRRLVLEDAPDLPRPPIDGAALAPGSYRATLRRDGRVVHVPFEIRAGGDTRIELGDDEARAGAGEVYVAGGPALLGGGDDLFEPRPVDVPAFFAQRTPVTFAELLEFLDDAWRADPAAAAAWMPQTRDGSPHWRRDRSGFVAIEPGRWGIGEDELRACPAFGVDVATAVAFAGWKSRRTGWAYRLPGSDEWEKAARGVDGRRLPWGDRFDPSFCKMRQSRPGLPRPEPPGRFAHDESPFGLFDCGGCIAEWVVPPGVDPWQAGGETTLWSAGGAWCDSWHDCVVTSRRPYLAVERSARVGFRLVRAAAPAATTGSPRTSR